MQDAVILIIFLTYLQMDIYTEFKLESLQFKYLSSLLENAILIVIVCMTILVCAL